MRWRVLGAVALLVSAAVHLKLWFGGVRDQSVGPAFLVNVVAGVVIAVLLVRWHHWLPAFLTLGFGVATLGAFVLATTVGLMGVHEHWEGFAVFAAAGAEVVCILVGAGLLRAQAPLASMRQVHRTV
ncbi:hypothetical protein [Pedococcus sp. 5OH_020]|uniref:hypothetical protein n=1 Tax=Pedococcus sp. 5OH_020 TaxID=2989814 RepID=UPI0022E9BC63|nr:hypothetical protein [Pedococcus sp. 5OH_020]